MHHHLSAIILEYKKTTLRGPLLYFGLVFLKSILFFTWVGVFFFFFLLMLLNQCAWFPRLVLLFLVALLSFPLPFSCLWHRFVLETCWASFSNPNAQILSQSSLQRHLHRRGLAFSMCFVPSPLSGWSPTRWALHLLKRLWCGEVNIDIETQTLGHLHSKMLEIQLLLTVFLYYSSFEWEAFRCFSFSSLYLFGVW